MAKRAIIWLAVSTEAQANDEKNSLPTQEKEAKEIVNREGWEITDILRVPGHSRSYIDIHLCAEEMRKKGIDAFDKLLRHWDAADFDVLVVRDASRFARTQSLHSYVVERTIDVGAEIYSIADGIIGRDNHRMFISMGGYSAASEIDNLKKRRQFGFQARVKRGLPANHSVPSSHKIIRDMTTGKALHVELDLTKSQMWRDLATLILQGVAWRRIESEMYEQFGYTNELSEAFNYPHFYRLVYTPAFWGHTAMRFKLSTKGAWIYQEGEPVPEGVEIYYNMIPSVWTGELAEKIKAELRRRETVIKGKAKPEQTKPFTGIFICGECSYNLSYSSKDSWQAWRCMSRYEKSSTRPDCSQSTSLPHERARTYIDSRLKQMVEFQDPTAFFPAPTGESHTNEKFTSDLKKEITQLENQIRSVIRDKAGADDDIIRGLYDEEIKAGSKRLSNLKKRLKDTQFEIARHKPDVQRRAYEEIAELSVEEFWGQEDRKINQLLHRLMGNKRFVVLEGYVVGIADAPKHKRRFNG
ncbi:MAG: recombinase family protein [Aggregatilineales bacterium]